MINKIQTFLIAKDKIALIKLKIIIVLDRMFLKKKFNDFGRNSYIIKPQRIIGSKHITIGDNVSILHNIRMEAIEIWKSKKYNPSITIGDNVSIGQNFHITSASDLKIGDNVTIIGNCFITNIDHNYQDIDVNILKQDLIINETIIGENCFIGFGACIQAGTKLGKQCVVGANSVVKGDFDDFSVIVGAPGKVVKKYNTNLGVWEKVKHE